MTRPPENRLATRPITIWLSYRDKRHLIVARSADASQPILQGIIRCREIHPESASIFRYILPSGIVNPSAHGFDRPIK